MALTPEWRRRIDQWCGTLKKLQYEPLVPVTFSGTLTREHVDPQAVPAAQFKPMPPGTRWGAQWEFCWFKGSVTLPSAARGQRIELHADVGAESAVLINGSEAGAIDDQHKHITLSTKGVPGTTYDILIEGYAGHGGTPCGDGPVPDGVQTTPPVRAKQRTVGTTTIGIWFEDLYQALMDAVTLLQLRDHMDPNSLRVAQIDEGLREFTRRVDLELPRAELLETVCAGRAALKPLLACVNGSSAPLMYCFGHSHIDVAWLWPLPETERKCRRTFATQLALMDEYPEYIFLQSQAHLYQMVKSLYPALYNRLKRAAKRGQWVPDGGMWVEPDTNLAGGESLIRQFMHGKRFFKEEFGVENELMWLPDVFGYSGALPQIMQGCSIKYFSTQKIFWAYNGGDPFPYNTFWWEGIDGSRILAHIHNDYNARTEPVELIHRWNERVQKDGIVSRLYPFGYGDGGGGPLRDHLEFLRRCANLEGVPRTKQCAPVEFFKDEEDRNAPLPTYVGELYFQAHRGTYTSQARVKKGNRQSEIALRDAELWGAVATARTRYEYPLAQADALWKLTLLNQFHDILPGSSIARVYEDAARQHAQVISEATALADAARAALVSAAPNALAVFNALSFERSALVPLPAEFRGAQDAQGNPLPVQTIEKTTYTCVPAIPACGWTTIRAAAPAASAGEVQVTATLLENAHLRIQLNRAGELVSIFDKAAQRELAAAPCNRLLLYKDVPVCFDAWDIDSSYKDMPVDISGAAKISVIATGPLCGVVRVQRAFSKSTLTQDIILRADSRRVDFRTSVDWHEKHKLLKVSFPVNVHSDEALHEIQFGHVRRPTHASRPFDADRFEVCNHKWTALAEESGGVAILNDCKYGLNVARNVINLTLLKAAQAPDMTADQGMHEFTYSFYCWQGSLFESGVVRAAYDLNVPVTTRPGAAEPTSVFSVDASNIIIETVKPAEDGSGDIILRLYECMRTATQCRLQTTLAVVCAQEATMLESPTKKLVLRKGCVQLCFHPFEIKTLRISSR
jgi:alpha-mannosidase